jgi:hypothetical protein
MLHAALADPGINWKKDARVTIQAAPDGDDDPAPEAVWPDEAIRSGVCGAVTPRVLRLGDGSYRMYYTQILPRPGYPAGANDYDNATTRILSALSENGETWTPEPGIRLTPEAGDAGEFRVVVTDVVPVRDVGLRMYYECAPGPQSDPATIRSAVSEDGLLWHPEEGARFGGDGGNYASARLVFLSESICRLYFCRRGTGIVSASSEDGGLTFREEPGVRIDQSGPYDCVVAFAPEVISLPQGGYVMYYAGYASANRAYILRATSEDGLTWQKEPEPVISPGGRWDRVKCSEVCVFPLPDGSASTYGMLYEACDGTSTGERGVWRIIGARSTT